MSTNNSCHFVGTLAAEPELRKTESGKYVCTVDIAVRNVKTKPTYVRLVFWEATAENLVRYARKGRQIAVTARYSLRDAEDIKTHLPKKYPEFHVESWELTYGVSGEQKFKDYFTDEKNYRKKFSGAELIGLLPEIFQTSKYRDAANGPGVKFVDVQGPEDDDDFPF